MMAVQDYRGTTGGTVVTLEVEKKNESRARHEK